MYKQYLYDINVYKLRVLWIPQKVTSTRLYWGEILIYFLVFQFVIREKIVIFQEIPLTRKYSNNAWCLCFTKKLEKRHHAIILLEVPVELWTERQIKGTEKITKK